MKSAKLSARMTPKLLRSVSQRKTDATAAPTRPIRPSPAIGMRSPGWRNASASIAAAPASATISDRDDGGVFSHCDSSLATVR